MSATNASLAWAAEQTATFYKLLAHKLKDAGEDAPTGSVFEGGMQLALGGDGEPATSKGGKRALKKAARADKPKRPPSAYNVFIVQESAKLKEAGFKSDKDHNLMKEIGAKWAAMSEAEKQAYKDKCEAEGRTGPKAVEASRAVFAAGGGAGPSGNATPATPANNGGSGLSSEDSAEAEARRRRKEEKRRKKEAKKRAAAEAAGGEEHAHKKHKHSHHH